jgi:hypothetical protein
MGGGVLTVAVVAEARHDFGGQLAAIDEGLENVLLDVEVDDRVGG